MSDARIAALRREYSSPKLPADRFSGFRQPGVAPDDRPARFATTFASNLPGAAQNVATGYWDMLGALTTFLYQLEPEQQITLLKQLPAGIRDAVLRGVESVKQIPEKVAAATPESAGRFGAQLTAEMLLDPGRLANVLNKGVPTADIVDALRRRANDVSMSDEAFLAELSQFLSPAERAGLRKGDVKNMRMMFEQFSALNPEVLAGAAIAGRAKKGWYENSGRALRQIFGDDTDQFVTLLAATSPRVSVEGNLTNALAIWRDWNKLGRPTNPKIIDDIMEDAVQRSPMAAEDKSSVLGAWRNNTRRALSNNFADPLDEQTAFLSGPKVEAFRRALLGDSEQVVNDAWQATATGQNQANFSGRAATVSERKKIGTEDKSFRLPGPGYMATSAATRETARRLTELTGEQWTPAEVQETIWSLTKAAWEKADATKRPIREVIRELQHSEVADVPDFSGLLGQGEYGKLLTEAGYGPQVENLAQAFKGQQLPSGRPADLATDIQVGLRPYERHLASTYLQRRLPRDLRDVRANSSRSASDVGGELFEGRSGELGADDLISSELREFGAKTYVPNDALISALRRFEVSRRPIVELQNTPAAADFFRSQILRSKENLGQKGSAVFAYDTPDYMDMRLFVSPQGGAGFALKPVEQGGFDLVSLFNNSAVSGQHGFAYPALMLGMNQGANRLDAFDTVLPNIYSVAGFEPSARLPFDPKQAPVDWNVDALRRFNRGQPDVTFMHLPKWKPTDRGVMRPPEVDVVPIAPPVYPENQKARNDLLVRSFAGALRRQNQGVMGTAAERELVDLAAASGGRVPPKGRERAQALREWRARRKEEELRDALRKLRDETPLPL